MEGILSALSNDFTFLENEIAVLLQMQKLSNLFDALHLKENIKEILKVLTMWHWEE